MATKVAPPKNTGGGGFVFEDDVCAWFMACILAGEPVFEADLGAPVRIDFQTRVDGWLLDDVLLHMVSAGGACRVALSLKSNAQFTAASAPADFVDAAWRQWRRSDSAVFDTAQDKFGLVTGPMSQAARTSVDGLLARAAVSDPQTFGTRLAASNWASEDERQLFASFHCPAAIPGTSVDQTETTELLKRFRVLSFDLGSTSSVSLKQALRLCKAVVSSHSDQEADALWQLLRSYAAECRPKAGKLDRHDIVNRLRGKASLVDYPDHRADWKKLDARSTADATAVVDSLGGQVRLAQQQDLQKLRALLGDAGSLTIIAGPSGVGKSVLARRLYEERVAEERRILWVDASSLDVNGFAAFEAALQLEHPLPELLSSVADDPPVLIIDGLERLYNETAFRNAATLLRHACAPSLGTKWCAVCPCQSQERPRVFDALQRAGLPLLETREYSVEPDSAEARALLGKKLPALTKVLLHPGILSLSANFKFLDLLARRVASGSAVDTSQWVGESSVAEWFWAAEIDRGANRLARGNLVRRLAERQADALLAAVSVDEFDAQSLEALETLIADRVCQRIPGDRVAFAHDLYADWVRLRILLNQGAAAVPVFIEHRRDKPLWHRALRLFAIHALEHQGGLTAWRDLLRSFGGSGPNTLHDLVLEAPVFAANPRPLLDAIGPDLLAGDGVLLRRLLSRFLMFATLPDEQGVAIGVHVGMDVNAARAHFRMPYWPYWLDVLAFLHANREAAVEYAAEQLSQITELWLKFTSRKSVRRKEAAGIAVTLGRFVLGTRRVYGEKAWRETRKRCYRCLLAAASEAPDEVVGIALSAAERWIGPDAPPPTPDPEIVRRGLGSQFPRRPLPPPWRDGPRSRVDDDLQAVVLDQNGALPLFRERPAEARELILACMIDEPEEEHWGASPLDDRELNFAHHFGWFPALFLNGPFLACLNANFEEGLALIKSVVDFATERWLARENRRVNAAKAQALRDGATEADVEQMFRQHVPKDLRLGIAEDVLILVGGEGIYGWSAGHGAPAVASALMALEKYLYLQLEEGRQIGGLVRAILTDRMSAAFAGLLCDVGRKVPALFEGPLRPLLSAPEIFSWEISKVIQGRGHLRFGAYDRGELFAKEAQEFHGLDHRKTDLRLVVTRLALGSAALREYFSLVKGAWASARDDDERISSMRTQLAAILDVSKYELREDPEHGHVVVNVEVLQQQEARKAEREQSESQMLLLAVPMRCRALLDSRAQMEDADFEKLWSDWTRVLQLRESLGKQGDAHEGDADFFEDRPSIAAIAGVAVFLSQNRTRLSGERTALVRDQARAMIAAPPGRGRLDFDEAVVTWSVDGFFLEAVALLYAGEPANVEWREAVARAVMWPRYGSTRLLFARLFEARASFRADFSSLRRLALASAKLRVRAKFMEHVAEHLDDVDDDALTRMRGALSAWVEEQVASFVAGTLGPMPEHWSECFDAERFKELEEIYQRRRHARDLDLTAVVSAHGWSPLPSRALDAEERAEWLVFWKEALGTCISRPALTPEKDGQFYPDEEERWVLSHVSALLLEISGSEAVDFWKPVLDLPTYADDWPEMLLERLHRAALTAVDVPIEYIPLVHALVQHALAKQDPDRWSRYDKVWDALLGIDGYTCDLWEPKHAALVEKIVELHELWWSGAPMDGRRIARYARWLKRPAAKVLRLRALRWLSGLLGKISKGRADDCEEAEDALAALLDCVWQEQEAALRQDTQAFESFRAVLGWLVDRQNPRGLELSERLGRLA